VATVIFVPPSLPVRNMKELVALAKARPGELNYASVGAEVIASTPAAFRATIADDTALWAGVIREMGSRAE
jgi:tripartite-type tricarboxylate transporter receptor subunit TctC